MKTIKKIFKLKYLWVLVPGLLFSALAFAGTNNYVSLSVIASSVGKTIYNLSTVLVDVSIISGVGFVMASFFKFHQHKQNPQQVQMSQGVSLLLIGCGLTLVPLLIPTGAVAVLGSKGQNTSQINGSDIHKLIGNVS
jgi:intracellular multiplication protein IcmD